MTISRQHYYWDVVWPTLRLGCSTAKTNVRMQPGVWGQSPQQALNLWCRHGWAKQTPLMQLHCIYLWKLQKLHKITWATVLASLWGWLQVYSCNPLSIWLLIPAIVQLHGFPRCPTTILWFKAQNSVDISNRLILCSPYQQILPSAVQQDLVGALCLISMFSSCFSHFSNMIYSQSHYYTHKWMISHESKLFPSSGTLSWPSILGF